ncbi:MAG: R3H domain-containing nucleic acid-binding protein [Phormidesmis sp.]
MEKSTSWLEKLLTLQGLKASVSGEQMTGDEDDSYWLTIGTDSLSPAEVDSLIGERGQVLDSIQYLANITLNTGQSEDEQRAYTIEINGYREKRQAELKTLAEAAAEQVIASGQSQEIKGLSAAERRHVHGLLGEYEQLETFSRGREPERHLVVKMATESAEAEAEAEETTEETAEEA